MRTGDEPLAWATQVGDYVFSSTVTGRDPETGELADGAEAQFDRAYDNLQGVIEQAELSPDEVAHVTVVINDASYREHINRGWLELFTDEGNRPARKTNHARLPDGELVNLYMVGVAGLRREAIEIPGLAHRDPIPMGTKIGNLLFSSVLGGDDPATGQRPDGDEQVSQVFRNMRSLVERAGGGVQDIARVWSFLGDAAHRPAQVKAWVEMFPDEGDRPASKTIPYDLGGRTTVIQLQMSAVIGSGRRQNFEVDNLAHHDPVPLASKQAGVLHTSGIGSAHPGSGERPQGPRKQMAQALENMRTLAQMAGGSTENIAQVTLMLGDNSYRAEAVESWREFFADPEDRPALNILELGLPGRDNLIQLHAVGVF